MEPGMVGEVVMDRFRLEERIGSGGMGTVYRAFDERLQRRVAVKEVMVGSPERVIREAQAAARLNHPGVVALFEFGVEGHRALLVSELVTGSTLDELVREGQLCDRDVAELGSDVCAALEHAHERGVVHRDVKPQNVIARDEAGAGHRAKLMDFGIASLAGAPTLTATGDVVGTLAYMAPEQAEGERAGREADTYSLALTLYECWAGENPVRRSTPAQTARELGSPLPSLAEFRPDLPPRLCEVIDACLRAAPEERPPLAELHAELEAAISNLDCDYALPAPSGKHDTDAFAWRPRGARIAAIAGSVGLCIALAGPLGLPGVALLVALLGLPALIAAATLERAALPGLAVVLAGLSLTGAYPAAVAWLERTPLTRAAMGALGWCWAVSVSAALGIAPPLVISEPPPRGWDTSVSTSFDVLISPLLEPSSLIAMSAFAVGAATLGAILAARHLALAALGALIWAAALAAALRLAGDAGLDWAPAVIAASALCAVAAEHRVRSPKSLFAGRDRPPAEAPTPGPAAPRTTSSASASL
jgi:hypothetical protein